MRNGNQWTEGRFNGFIKNVLRAGSNKWPPKWDVKKAARQGRNKYLCAGYETEPHVCGNADVIVDHIDPVIPVDQTSVSWDMVIERLFCERENLQVLCKDCHKRKTRDENKKRKSHAR